MIPIYLALLALEPPVVATQEQPPGTFDLFRPAASTRKHPLVLLLGEPIDGPDSLEVAMSLRELGERFAASGVMAARVDWTRRGGGRDLRDVTALLLGSADDFGIDAARIGLHAHGSGAQVALDAAMEEGGPLGSALSLRSGAGVVIERLRADLPLLLITDPDDPERTRRGMRELALQSELCMAALTLRAETGDAAAATIVTFHCDRLLPLPANPADVDDFGRAFAIARVHAERGAADDFYRWLARAHELGLDDVDGALHDGALVKLRATPRFRDWVAAHTMDSCARLCRDFEPGRRIAIRARVVEHDGMTPVADALVHLWQTDRTGLYAYDGGDDSVARLYAFVRTDADGCFEVETIEPGGYPQTMIPAHIHLTVKADGRRDREFEFVFDDDPRMVDSGRERAQAFGWPIVVLREEAGRTVGDATIVLRDERPGR